MMDKNYIIKRVQTTITLYPIKCRRSQIPDYIHRIKECDEGLEAIESNMFINDRDKFTIYEDTESNPFDVIVDMNDKEDIKQYAKKKG
jgi:hypothetical protein